MSNRSAQKRTGRSREQQKHCAYMQEQRIPSKKNMQEQRTGDGRAWLHAGKDLST